MTSYTK